MADKRPWRRVSGRPHHSMTESALHPRRGFTLAELAVVITIMALVLAVALPRFAAIWGHEHIRHTARQISAFAAEANSRAMSRHRPLFLCVDLTGQGVWLSTVRPGPEGDAGRDSHYYRAPSGVSMIEVVHPNLGTVKEGRVSFAYWPRGGGEPGTIHLRSEDGEELTLFLRPYLGRLDIEAGYLSEEIQ